MNLQISFFCKKHCTLYSLGKKYIEESIEVEKLSKEASMKNKKKTKYSKQNVMLRKESLSSKKSINKHHGSSPSICSNESGNNKSSKKQDISEVSFV